MKRLLLAALSIFGVTGLVRAAEIANQAVIANETALAANNTYYLDVSQVGHVSMQVTAGSATIGTGSFTDGSASTGTFTVLSYTALSSATATGAITIASNTATVGTCVSGGGGPGTFGNFNVCNPRDWQTDLVTTSNTVCNLAQAIDTQFGVSIATCGLSAGTVVYTTAPVYGAAWNSFQLSVSSYGAETLTTFVSSVPYQVGYASMSGVGIGTLSGGQDNQSFSINGFKFTANATGPFGFYPVTSTAQTATNIATAVNGSSVTVGVAAAAGAVSTTVVFTTSTKVGSNTNYVTVTSTYSQLQNSSSGTLVGSQATSAMTGGTNAAYLINSATITIAGNAFTSGLQVLYSTSSGVGINGLVYGTTYYIIDMPPPGPSATIALATSLANAQAGVTQAVQLTSSQTNTTADTFTLAPLAETGNPSMRWIVSNDRTNWLPWTVTTTSMTISSYTIGSFTSGGYTNYWDPGQIDWNWLGLSVVGPTTGGITLKAFVAGKP